jgi:hypothetical protein
VAQNYFPGKKNLCKVPITCLLSTSRDAHSAVNMNGVSIAPDVEDIGILRNSSFSSLK